MKPLDPTLHAEIDSLSKELETFLTRRPGTAPADFPAESQVKRHALLARHLGFTPAQPVPLLHCIGDSHAMFFSGAERMRFIRYGSVGLWRRRYINRSLDLLPCFRVFHTGPSTAWKAAEFGSSTRNREKIEWLLKKTVPHGSRVLLSFGEIDCRIHMPKQVLAGKTVSEVVEATAAHFLPLVRRVVELGFDTTVWGVAQISPRLESDPRLALPAAGPVELRNEITYAYNAALGRLCEAAKIRHVSLAGTFHTASEPMPEECFYDGVHLSQVVMPHALQALQQAGVLSLS
ncbi:MAG: hypothetical protein JWO82_4193 [Akkermansiaceae bacterium]|nr:hypothetical protein [Akkermansiaceae bacterium]